jgi:hypothetical protein
MSDQPDNPITPDAEPTREELEAASVMRPLAELPSPFSIVGHPRLPEPSITALSPDDQKAVREVAGSTDPEAVQAALLTFLQERSVAFRIRAGAGDGASAPEREALSQINQLRLLTEEFARLDAELAEIVEHRTEYDDSGNAVPVPVYAFQGSLRTAREARKAEVQHQMGLLAGMEGEAAMERAVRDEVLNQRQRKAQIEEQREVARRAHQIASERRINAAAEARAKHL